MLRSRHARREMREDQVVPAVQRDQTIERREFDPRLPFFCGHVPLQGLWSR